MFLVTRVAALALSAALAAGACGSTPPISPAASGAPAPSNAATGGPSSALGATPSSASSPSAPVGGPVILPAGVQFLDPGRTLPVGFGSAMTQTGQTLYIFGSKNHAPAIATESAPGTWVVKALDDKKGLDAPAGSPYLWQLGILPVAAAAGDAGIVLAGTGQFSKDGSKAATNFVAESYLWFSPDGSAWTRLDPRSFVGDPGSRVVITNVMVSAGSFWAVGSLVPAGGAQKARALALRSPDGRTWSAVSSLASTWTTTATAVYEVGGTLVLAGREFSCFTGSNIDRGLGPQLRLWSADTAGTSWTPVDLTAAGPAMQPPNPAPTTAAGCPPASDYLAFQTKYQQNAAFIGAAGGTLVALGPASTDAVATSDLVHWTTVALPGAAPGLRSGDYAPNAYIDIGAHLLTADAEGLVLRTFGPRRDAGNFRMLSGWSVQWWRSRDAGATWVAGPAGKPIFGGGAFVRMIAFADGTAGVIQVPTSAAGPSAKTSFARSAAGPAVDWAHCNPGPKADCSWATISGSYASADWSGMTAIGTTFVGNFTGVNLTEANLDAALLDGLFTGANFTDAQLYGVQSVLGDFSHADFARAFMETVTLGAPLTGADLTGVDGRGGTFAGDLTGADLAGAQFTGARLDPSYKQGLHLAQAKLDYITEDRPTKLRDMSGANYAGLYLAGLVFSRVNLTGANFAGADLTGATFAADVACPDGKPGDPSVTGAGGCRITP